MIAPAPVPSRSALTDPISQLEVARLIADAYIPRTLIKGRGVSPTHQKAVLLAVWRYEGRPLAGRALMDRTAMSASMLYMSLSALDEGGFITIEPRGNRDAASYWINLDRLRRAAVKTPLAKRRAPRKPGGCCARRAEP